MLRELLGSEALVLESINFIGQEGTHRFIHVQFDERLEQHGYCNRWEDRYLCGGALLGHHGLP